MVIKKYDSAINFLNAVLNYEGTNKEANDLKNEYDSQIKKQKEDEENKARELQVAEPLKKETAQKNTNLTVKNTTSQNASTNSNTQKSSNTVVNSKTEQSSNFTTSYTETVGVSNGWFSIKKNDGILAPNGFGIRQILYVDTFSEIYFDFVQGSAGEALNYDIIFHLQGKDLNYKGTASNNLKSIPVSLNELPKGYNVKIDVSVVYKGKTYNDTFYKVLNNS